MKGRRWCFTINNFDEDPENASLILDLQSDDSIPFIVIEMEHTDDNGTPHFQGYLEYKGYTTRNNISKKLHDIAHIELAKGTREDNICYCSKEAIDNNQPERLVLVKGLSIPDIKRINEESKTTKKRKVNMITTEVINDIEQLSWDEIKVKYPQYYLNKFSTLIKIKAQAKTLKKPEPFSLKIKNYWLCGPAGTGKSSWIKSKCEEINAGLYIKGLDKWWDGYNPNEHQCVLIDDFDPNVEPVVKGFIKRWGDHGPLNEDIKGGKIQFYCNDFVLVVTSNYTIEQCFDTSDVAAIKRRFLEINYDVERILNPKFEFKMIMPPPYLYLLQGIDPAIFGINLDDPCWKGDSVKEVFEKPMDISMGEDDERPGKVEKIPAHGIYAGIERYTDVYGKTSEWKYSIDKYRYQSMLGGNPEFHTSWFTVWEDYFDQCKAKSGKLYEEEMRLREQRRKNRNEMEKKWTEQEKIRRNSYVNLSEGGSASLGNSQNKDKSESGNRTEDSDVSDDSIVE